MTNKVNSYRLPVWKLSTWQVTLLISLFLTLFTNFSFWSKIFSLQPITESPAISVTLFLVIVGLINLVLTLVSFKPIFKIICITIILCSASAAYFMDSYAVMIDKSMIRNIFATDIHEAAELFSLKLVITIFLLGIIPSFLLLRTEINYKPFFKGLAHKGLAIIISAAVISGTLFINYKEFTLFGRDNREVRHLINPINYIGSIKSIVSKSIKNRNYELKSVGDDAKIALKNSNTRKPSLVILVLGETARSMNFSLNGYQRNTNPLLAKQDIINFGDVTSCGTATAVSVPCMFSKFSRNDFNYDKGREYENLFDVISHAGYKVLWRDNNTGCQGTCKRIAFEHMLKTKTPNPKFCKKR